MFYTKEQLFDVLPAYIREKNVDEIRDIFIDYNIVDLSEIFETLDTYEAIFCFRVLRKDISARLFSYLYS